MSVVKRSDHNEDDQPLGLRFTPSMEEQARQQQQAIMQHQIMMQAHQIRNSIPFSVAPSLVAPSFPSFGPPSLIGMHSPMGMGMPFVQPSVMPFGAGAIHVSHSYPSAPVVPSYPVGGGSGVPSIQSCHINVGSRIFIRGHIHPNAHRFELNFLQGYNDGDDVAFHFNPRFDSRTIVKNHRRHGQWGSEENQPFPSYMPLMPGVPIDLQITCQTDRYTVYMNNHLIAEFRHKIPPGFVQAIQYKGDITVTSVGQL